MKLIISKAELLRVAKPVAQAAAKKGSVTPIHEHVLIAAVDNLVNLYAGDGIVFLKGAASADVAGEGQIAVNAGEFIKRIESMPDGPLVLASECAPGTRVVNAYSMRSQTSARKHQYPCMNGDDFPTEPSRSEDAVTASIAASKIKDVLQRVTHAAADDTSTRFGFICVESDGTSLSATACNAHRFARASAECGAPSFRFDVSVSSAERIVSILGDARDAELWVTQGNVSVGYDCFECIAKNGDGIPSVNHILDGQDRPAFDINAAMVVDALKAIKLSADNSSVSVTLKVKDRVLHAHGSSADKGSSEDEIPGVDYRDTESVAVSADYLKDAILGSKCERVRIHLGEPIDQVRVFGSNFEAVIAPMRQ